MVRSINLVKKLVNMFGLFKNRKKKSEETEVTSVIIWASDSKWLEYTPATNDVPARLAGFFQSSGGVHESFVLQNDAEYPKYDLSSEEAALEEGLDYLNLNDVIPRYDGLTDEELGSDEYGGHGFSPDYLDRQREIIRRFRSRCG